MGCSSSKLDGLPAVSLCRDRCNSLEETLRLSYALADAHSAYLLSLTTIGPSIHRFFDQAVDSTRNVESEEEPDPSPSAESSSVSSSYERTNCGSFERQKLQALRPSEPYFQNHETLPPPPPPPPSNYVWDFMNVFESYEFPYIMNAKDLKERETTHCLHEDTFTKKKVPLEKKIKVEEEKESKIAPREYSKDQNISSDFSQVTKQLEEMFKQASESGNHVSKMFDTSRFRYFKKKSVYQDSSHTLYAKKMTHLDPKPEEDFGSYNISSTLKKLFMWEKKLYQEVKAEEKLRTCHMKYYKQLKRLEQKSTNFSKIEATVQCLSTRMRVSIHKIDNICSTINKLRDEELWCQMKELIHRLSEMWSSMFECHTRQSRVIADDKKFDKMTLKENLDISQLELAMELKLELRNWSQSLSNWTNAQAQYVKALNSWLMQCLKQEPQEPTPDLSEEPPLFGAINTWSQTLSERLNGEKDFKEAIYVLLMHVNRQVEKQRMESDEQRDVNGGVKDVERKLVMLKKEEQKMQRNMKTVPSVEVIGSLNLKSNLELIFKSMEKLATNSKQTYVGIDLMCT